MCNYKPGNLKKITFCGLFLLIVATAFCQHKQTAEAYRFKARKLGTAGWFFAAGGTAMIVAGALLINGDHPYHRTDIDFQEASGLSLIGNGVICSLGSIPFFITSAVMRKKARKASAGLKVEKFSAPYSSRIAVIPYPALSIKINL